jgi:serine---pyruvate transaminase
MTDPFIQQRLFCPGPTPIPFSHQLAMLEGNIYHRSSKFRDIFTSCTERLKPIFGTAETPLILTCSGTGVMEAAVVNLTSERDQVLVVSAGKFGERWGEIAESYGCQVSCLTVPWGESPTPEQLLKEIEKHKNLKAIFLQANETSTAVQFSLGELLPAVRKVFAGIIVIDAISYLVAQPMKMDEWQIDCVVSGSQKGFSIPPGLGFIGLSKKAWQSLSKRPKHYFDLLGERQGQALGKPSFTPAISLIMGLNQALETIGTVGLPNIHKHHEKLARAARSAIAAMGLDPLAKSNPSQVVTGFYLPEGFSASEFKKHLTAQYGAVLAGGQGPLQNRVLRIAHLGLIDRFHLLTGLAAIEFGLKDMGIQAATGNGVKAAMEELAKPS